MKKIIILLLILALGVASVTACGKKDKGEIPDGENTSTDNNNQEQENEEPELPGVNYYEDDLSEYIGIDPKHYHGFEVVVDPGRVSELDIGNKIIQLLCKYKSAEPVEGDGVITVGDMAHIFYKGYYMKDGEPYFFQGGDNTESESSYALEIGSGGFIPGFEYNLIGKNPSDFTEENPIVVETFFPENYQSAELAGKTAYFIVTVEKLVEYDAPELDDSFVSETLKLSESDLLAYKGETLSEKYYNYVREEVLKEKGLDLDTLVMDAFWNAVIDNAVVKKYPEKQVKETYDAFIEELDYYYGYYSYYYGYEYNTFMCLYLGLKEGADWKAHVEELAKKQVKEQLIFYHVMHTEGFKPTAEQYDALFEEYLTEALEAKGITPDKYQTEQGYNTAKEDYKNQLLKNNGEDYFKSMIYYKTTCDGIKGLANIVEIAE